MTSQFLALPALTKIPSHHQYRLLNANLLKLLMKPVGAQKILSTSRRKAQTELIRHDQQIRELHRRVREVSHRFFKELLHDDSQPMKGWEYHEWRKKWDSGMKKRVNKFVESAEKIETARLQGGLAALAGKK